MPYSAIIGQKDLRLALELAFVVPEIGGVLLSGERGTGKSTAVRSFSQMTSGRLPVTIPINATEDRLVGGWDVDELLKGRAKFKKGLIEEAKGRTLFIDEVNLLQDHLVNIILDVTSTGVLEVQREGHSFRRVDVRLTMVGTMNPDEGGLRPQLLDRFGLAVVISSEPALRKEILRNMLLFDEARAFVERGEIHPFVAEMSTRDQGRLFLLSEAKKQKPSVPESILDCCADLASEFGLEGHRGEHVLALAASGLAALQGELAVTTEHLKLVAPLTLRHRRRGCIEPEQWVWEEDQANIVEKVIRKWS